LRNGRGLPVPLRSFCRVPLLGGALDFAEKMVASGDYNAALEQVRRSNPAPRADGQPSFQAEG
jgi:hypothetical protein